jgi:hypothetical protein
MISTPSIVQIKYFGADPEGSVGMLFFPMSVLYFLSGAFIYFTIKAIKKITQEGCGINPPRPLAFALNLSSGIPHLSLAIDFAS